MAYQRTAARRILLIAWMLAFLVSALPAARPAQAASADLVISQVYGGGGNSGAPLKNDFVEIFNRGSAAVSLNGMSIQYTSATGTGNFGAAITAITDETAILQPGQYYLVQLAGGTNGVALPTADAVGTISMGATGGKVALVTGTSGLACNGNANICDAAALARIVDLVGFGNANYFEGSGATPAPSNTNAVLRASNGCTDTDNNSADFTAGAPVPRNSASPLNACGGTPVDIAPSVVSVTPANGAANVSLTADLIVTFSEPVTAASEAFGLSCTVSGTHSLAVSNTENKIFTLNPDADFQPGDSCTLTITAANVTDTDEPLDPMAANFTSIFSAIPATSCGGPATEIAAVQGTAETSPLVNTTVTLEGVVTGDFQGSSELKGFFIQDPTPDTDPKTSDGVFVYASVNPYLSVALVPGDRVRVSGSVAEFQGLTEITTLTDLTVCSSGAPLAPFALSLPESVNGDLEALESVLVTIAEPLTVDQNYFLGRYGQLTLSSEGRIFNHTNLYPAGSAEAAAQADENARRLLVLDDGRSSQNPNPIPYIDASGTRRAGDTVSGLTGVLDFGPINSNTELRDYRLHPTAAPVFAAGSNPRTAAPEPVGGTLRVSAFNVLNYFTSLGTANYNRGANNAIEFNRQRAKIFAALAAIDADVFGLIEIERTGDAVANLVDGLNAVVGAGTYAAIADPAAGVGSDDIKVAIIYKPARVTPVGASLSDTDTVYSRPPVAQTFQSVANGEKFTVVVNHFKSKGSCPASAADPNADQGDGQGCWNPKRVEQAQALLGFISELVTASGDPDVLVVGDLNAYAKEDPIAVLTAGGLVDQINRFVTNPYSYVFDGAAGYLDHALATASLSAQVTGTTEWHINADEPSVIDYNTEFKPQDLYAPTPYRSSDHDPVVLGLALSALVADPAPSVVSVAPANGAANVALDASLTLTFSEPVTLGPTALSLTCTASGAHALTASSSDAVVFILDPAVNFLHGESCTLTVTAAQVTDQDTNDPLDAMTSNFSASFQTLPPPDLAAPRVLSVSPANGLAGIAPDATVTLTFSEPVTLDSGAVSLSCSLSGPHVLTITSSDQVTFTVDPQANFVSSDLCTLTVAGSKVHDADSIDPLDTMAANFVSTFTVQMEAVSTQRSIFIPLASRGQP